MIIDIIRLIGDICWELTCTCASIGLLAVVAMVVVFVLQALHEVIARSSL